MARNDQEAKFGRFRELHRRPGAFVIPNPWDAGSARILTALGFAALATTSAGFAFSIGRRDSTGALTREMVLENARAIVDATSRSPQTSKKASATIRGRAQRRSGRPRPQGWWVARSRT
jgi:hypothetical protein